MADQERQEAERLWKFVEQLKRGTPPEETDDPLLRLAQSASEALNAPASSEEGRAAARARLTAAISGEKGQQREREKGRLLPRAHFPILPFHFRRSTLFVAAAAVLLLCAVVLLWRIAQPPAITATMLVKDHLKLLAEKSFAEYRSDDPTRVAFWLTHQVGFPVAAIDLASADARLLGGRRCQLVGQRIGLAFYERDNTRISLFQLKSGRCRLMGLEEVQVNGRTLLVGADKGFNVVAWQEHKTFCVMVSAMDTSTLLKVAEAAQQTKE